MAGPAEQPDVVWVPDPRRLARSQMSRFQRWLADERELDLVDYQSRWRWSVTEPEAFWGAVADFFQVSFHDRAVVALEERVMPGAQWFPGATLNYAEHALRNGPGKGDDDLAVVFRREDGLTDRLTFGRLRHDVAAVRAALGALGVRRGDRVVALVPNSPHALIAFLATASLGAIWSSCSPDFGVRAVTDRFAQIDPTVLVAVDGYLYN
ncbi:MAG TPA: AMP-binding protein, partial [Jiangellaceae bacterium]